ncbi:hypothetical protein [Paenibacillus sp. B01]|uniref:hypothetical protein n=1 Tax=Paenibacillus sp. B01 TaxID=2660554 RepID=UPI00129B3B99|nr:hypothetical protein [Paenibacillus sp. B01]QGG57684.1 hypothetical protein GE073_20180 [Paenibacillus sp. B01]
MSEKRSEKLLIKLVIGRTLIDTAEHKLSAHVEEGGRGWIITVSALTPREADYIGANVGQLNFFHFITEAVGGEERIRKFWLYDLDEPAYQYDPATGEAIFEVNARVAYSNERV